MSNTIPESLLNALKQGKVLPVVGAGVSMALRDKSGKQLFPSWKDLLGQAADRIEKENYPDMAVGIKAMLKLNKYQEAANIAREGLVGGLWNQFFTEVFSLRRDEVSDDSLALAEAVWHISRRIITLNYDKVLRFACPEQGVVELDNTSEGELADFARGDKNQYAIWHLHGKVDNVANIIFTGESYSKLYIDSNSTYKAALDVFRSICRDTHLLFIGCSLDDAELLEQLAMQHSLFEGNTGPHYALVRAADEARVKEKLSVPHIHIVTFEEFGNPLLETLTELGNHSPLQTAKLVSARKTEPSAADKKANHKIAILFAKPIDKQYQYDELLQEFKKLKCDVSYFYLSIKSLNELDGFDYIFVLSKVRKGKVVIEDETLISRRITLKELEDSIGNSHTKGLFFFLDHITKDDLDSADVAQLSFPALVLPQLTKSQIGSFSFKVFRKSELGFVDQSVVRNREKFSIHELKGTYKPAWKKSPLSEKIDAKSTRNFVGRNTDLQAICRKILDLRDKNEVLTIKGSGGIGKTITVKKAAIELAERNFFEAGIYFIDCEFIGEYRLFEHSVAQCFNLENALNVKAEIKEYLTKQDKLIILDNVESVLHVEDSVLIKDFINFVCDHATLVITSREVLNLECEQPYDLRQFTTDEAYELFVRESGNLKIDDADKRLIRNDILERLLDNNPLAIKLITKNIPQTKSFEALKVELEDDIFRKVSDSELEAFDSASDINIERKKSLYASINFSYQYLNNNERMAFELLSLFPDGINMENLKRISEDRKANKKGGTKEYVANELMITDPVIRALENKSMIQVDNQRIKLQSIIGKFAERRFRMRQDAEIKRYYKNAFDYNYAFSKILLHLMGDRLYLAAKILKSNQGNFIKSIAYIVGLDLKSSVVLDYLDDMDILFSHISARRVFIDAVEKQGNFSFSDAKEKLCYEVLLLYSKYFDGEFEKSFLALREKVSLQEILKLRREDPIEKILMANAAGLYCIEGDALFEAKLSMQHKIDPLHYPHFLYQIGELNDMLASACRVNFGTLETLFALGCLTLEKIDGYMRTIPEEGHLERMQVYYIKVKMGHGKKDQVKKQIPVNPYTLGLKHLMFAFLETDVDKKASLFKEALAQLTHIKYYYVEALYFYAEFLKRAGKEDLFKETYETGYALAKRHYYRFLIHKFENLSAQTHTEYDPNKYPLPDNLRFDDYIDFLIKAKRSVKPS